MSGAREFATHITDLPEAFGHHETKGMLGGYGIFQRGLMSGPIAIRNLYLEANAESRKHFDGGRGRAFSYCKQEREYRLSCLQAAEEFCRDETACLRWARLAFDAALRNTNRRRKSKP